CGVLHCRVCLTLTATPCTRRQCYAGQAKPLLIVKGKTMDKYVAKFHVPGSNGNPIGDKGAGGKAVYRVV
ncbi:unnamed protein product, partial [Closterium sp. Naga37s-1]